jgi:broad specificity phosphatase PhoE
LVLTPIFYYTSTRNTVDIDVLKMVGPYHYKYEIVKGYFQQSEDATDDTKFDFARPSPSQPFVSHLTDCRQRKENFGLIDREYSTETSPTTQLRQHWTQFSEHIRALNSDTAPGESYKVLFLGRHGQGWHNVAESKYGTKAWDCYYSLLDGYGGMQWSDALLTDLGKEQARDVNALWGELLPKGIPPPETFYVSPLTRAIETADITFNGLDLPEDRQYKPVVKELLREALGVHTCDRRSTATHIQKTFPHLTLEPGFTETDQLWEADYREPSSARKFRLSQFLDDVFEHDKGVFLSFTSHSGALGSILKATGHRDFALQTGGVIPVVVKATRVEGERKAPPKEPYEAPPVCDSPPEPTAAPAME